MRQKIKIIASILSIAVPIQAALPQVAQTGCASPTAQKLEKKIFDAYQAQKEKEMEAWRKAALKKGAITLGVDAGLLATAAAVKGIAAAKQVRLLQKMKQAYSDALAKNKSFYDELKGASDVSDSEAIETFIKGPGIKNADLQSLVRVKDDFKGWTNMINEWKPTGGQSRIYARYEQFNELRDRAFQKADEIAKKEITANHYPAYGYEAEKIYKRYRDFVTGNTANEDFLTHFKIKSDASLLRDRLQVEAFIRQSGEKAAKNISAATSDELKLMADAAKIGDPVVLSKGNQLLRAIAEKDAKFGRILSMRNDLVALEQQRQMFRDLRGEYYSRGKTGSYSNKSYDKAVEETSGKLQEKWSELTKAIKEYNPEFKEGMGYGSDFGEMFGFGSGHGDFADIEKFIKPEVLADAEKTVGIGNASTELVRGLTAAPETKEMGEFMSKAVATNATADLLVAASKLLAGVATASMVLDVLTMKGGDQPDVPKVCDFVKKSPYLLVSPLSAPPGLVTQPVLSKDGSTILHQAKLDNSPDSRYAAYCDFLENHSECANEALSALVPQMQRNFYFEVKAAMSGKDTASDGFYKSQCTRPDATAVSFHLPPVKFPDWAMDAAGSQNAYASNNQSNNCGGLQINENGAKAGQVEQTQSDENGTQKKVTAEKAD